MNINAPVGENDGWPDPLLVSWYGGAPSDAQTQAQLAQACLALGMRRRLVIPICGFRGFSTPTYTSIILPFNVHLPAFARVGRITGFYYCDSPSGCRVKLQAQITTPALTAKEIHMPPTTDASGVEFAMDIDVGDGAEGSAGAVSGFVYFGVVDETNAGTSTVVVYSCMLEVLPALQGEVATT